MKTGKLTTVSLGELIAAAFDEAARLSADPSEQTRLAACAVRHLVERPRKPLHLH